MLDQSHEIPRFSEFPEFPPGPEADFVAMEGRHRLVDLLYRGRVRLYGEGDAIIELWSPEPVDAGTHKVQLSARFSERMLERYKEPLPDNPTTFVDEYKFLESGVQDMDACRFAVEGWGLYSPEGERIRYNNRIFVLREISRIELAPNPVDTHGNSL